MRVKIRKENKFERSKRIKKLGGACAEFFTLHIEQKKFQNFFTLAVAVALFWQFQIAITCHQVGLEG